MTTTAHTNGSDPERSEMPTEQLVRAYRDMLRARLVDDKAITLFKQNKCHFQIGCAGHEAIQVASANVLQPGHDWAYPYYRDMAFVAALGMSNRELLLGILNKYSDPSSGGRQMPMHYGHKDLRIVSQSSPTGTQFLEALGTAMAVKYREKDRIVYVSAGDGTCAQGCFHEMLNWAARDSLPLVIVIQDNKYAISVPIEEQIAGESVAKIAQGYEGLEVVSVDGVNYAESYSVMKTASERARRGDGPTIVVADVVRLQSHSISDNHLKYRTKEDLDKDQLRDPLLLLGVELDQRGILSAAEQDALRLKLKQEIDDDTEAAEKEPDPPPHSCEDHVFVNKDPGAGVIETEPDGEPVFMVDALNHALDEELARNEEMVVYGQDVAYGKGGVFTVTSGLTDKYGVNRVYNAPLAEDSIIGSAFGMAVTGMKPCVEIQFGDYIWTGMMQLRNEVAMLHYRSNGMFSCPMVLRVPVGGYIHGALYHSQNIEATFAHFPGLHVIYPSNATDAKGLLKSAIRSSDPVLFLEHKGLYRQPYAKGPEGGPDDLIPIGRAKIRRVGQDVTLITWGAMLQKSLLAAAILAEEGYETEVIDIRSIVPLDITSILSSVKKTHRALIVHEDSRFMGFGAEIAALVADRAFEYLDAPIRRVAGRDTPIPHASSIAQMVLPQETDVEEALRALLEY